MDTNSNDVTQKLATSKMMEVLKPVPSMTPSHQKHSLTFPSPTTAQHFLRNQTFTMRTQVCYKHMTEILASALTFTSTRIILHFTASSFKNWKKWPQLQLLLTGRQKSPKTLQLPELSAKWILTGTTYNFYATITWQDTARKLSLVWEKNVGRE